MCSTPNGVGRMPPAVRAARIDPMEALLYEYAAVERVNFYL